MYCCASRPLCDRFFLQAKLVEKLYVNLGGLIRTAALCRKPDQNSFATLLTGLQKDIEVIGKLKDSNRKDRDWFNHLSAVAEGAPAVGWITLVRWNPMNLYFTS